MANRTDPLVNAVSGSDPQNLFEYIIRQKIYDSQFWKEQCFGLSVEDVLEKAVTCLDCITTGHHHSRFLALTLKLLQLHPESELIIETFIDQDEFKYVRALGCLYLRLTGRPVDIYETLEPLYRDERKLRSFRPTNPSQPWSIMYMDDFVHQLLTQTHAVNIALPRLPGRRTLQEAGYLPDGPRPTVLQDLLKDFNNDPIAYLKHKAMVEKCPAAIEAWKNRQQQMGGEKEDDEGEDEDETSPSTSKKRRRRAEEEKGEEGYRDNGAEDSNDGKEGNKTKKTKHKKKNKKKKERNYDNLFKKSSSSKTTATAAASSGSRSKGEEAPAAAEKEFSEEYWNEQRAKLGLKPLQK